MKLSDDEEIVICAYCGRNCIPDEDYRCPNCGQMGEFRTIQEGVSLPVSVSPEPLSHFDKQLLKEEQVVEELERLAEEEERLKAIESDKYTERKAVLPVIKYRPTRSRSRRRFGISMLEKQMVVAVCLIVLYMAANGFGPFLELPLVPLEKTSAHLFYQSRDRLTHDVGPSSMLLDVYGQTDIEMVLMERISNQDTSRGEYFEDDIIFLMAYDPTDESIVPCYYQYTVPRLTAGEVHDGNHILTLDYVVMPSQWNVTGWTIDGSPLTGDVNATIESQLMFQVTNREAETGYMESFDFLSFRWNRAYFFIETDTQLCLDYDVVFSSPATFTYLWLINAEELCFDQRPDGSYNSMGIVSVPVRIAQSQATTHVRYGLILNVDANQFLSSGFFGSDTIIFEDTFVLHEVSA